MSEFWEYRTLRAFGRLEAKYLYPVGGGECRCLYDPARLCLFVVFVYGGWRGVDCIV